jgi:UDP-glucose 4-epimerase
VTSTVLVTGAQGRIGRTLSKSLRAAGYQVRGIDRVTSDGDPEAVVADLGDERAMSAIVSGVDIVVHLAAFMSWREQDAAAVFRSNVDATFTLFEAVRSNGGAEVIVASSGEVYPESAPRHLPIDETHPTEPRTHYGMTKLLVEHMAWFYARRYGLPVTVLRFPHTQDATELLDPDSPMSGPRFFLSRKLEQQRQFGNSAAVEVLERYDNGAERLLLSRGADGTAYQMPICDTRDTVTGIVAAITRSAARGETIALGPPDSIAFDVAVPKMSALTGLDYVDVCLPGPAVHYALDLSKASRILGFEPIYDFDKMLAEAADAYHRREL